MQFAQAVTTLGPTPTFVNAFPLVVPPTAASNVRCNAVEEFPHVPTNAQRDVLLHVQLRYPQLARCALLGRSCV